MASSDVVVHELLHIVEDVSALENLESLAAAPVSGRDGVVAAGDDFFASGLGNQDAVVKPPRSIVEGSVGSWLVWSPRRVSCNVQVECLVLLFQVLPWVHWQQRVDVASGAIERVCCRIGGPRDVRDFHTIAFEEEHPAHLSWRV